MIVPAEQISAGNLIINLQFRCGHQTGKISIGRIIEEQKDLPRILIAGLKDFCNDFTQNLHGKRIEKIKTIDLRRYFIIFRSAQYKFRFAAGNGSLLIFQGTFINALIVFDAYGVGLRLVRQKKSHTPLSAAIVQYHIPFANQSAVGQPLQNAIRCRFIRIAVKICIGIIPS